MDPYQPVADKLNALNIDFQLVEHEPALTTEQADQFIEGIPGVRTKTMFLTDKKKRQFYLVIMDDSQRLDMDRFQDQARLRRFSSSKNELTLRRRLSLRLAE